MGKKGSASKEPKEVETKQGSVPVRPPPLPRIYGAGLAC